MKTFLKYAIMLGLTAFMLWLSVHNLDGESQVSIVDQLWIAWGKANKPFLLLSGFCALISHLVRAERWKLLLNPIGYKFSTFNSFLSVLTGYFVNLIIPRGGEVSRCVNLYRLNGVPINTSLGTVIAERVIDLIFLVLCIGGAFIIEFDVLIAFINDYKLQHTGDPSVESSGHPILWILVGLIVLGVIGFIILKSQTALYENLIIKVKNFLMGLKQGVVSVFNLEKNILFIFYSVLIWVLYYFMAYFVIIAFPESEHLGLMAALSIFVIGGIAMAMPVPGGTGSYHLFVSSGLVFLYGLPNDQAFAFTTIFHGWQTLVIIVFGAASLFLSQILGKKDVSKQSTKDS